MKWLLGILFALAAMATNGAELPLERIKLPPGFAIELWARVENARQMALGHEDSHGGTLFVGSMRAGNVNAVRFDTDYKVKSVVTIASGLQMPVGVAYRDGNLYVSAVNRILRYDNIEQHLDHPLAAVVVTDTPTKILLSHSPQLLT
jgi:glucose/arabinose dehydrogenase